MNDTDLIVIDARIKKALDKNTGSDGIGCLWIFVICTCIWYLHHLGPLLDSIKARLDRLDPPKAEATEEKK